MAYSEPTKTAPIARVSPEDVKPRTMMAMRDNLAKSREVEEITERSRSSIYKMMLKGEFHRPVRVGPIAVSWRASNITPWTESRSVAQ